MRLDVDDEHESYKGQQKADSIAGPNRPEVHWQDGQSRRHESAQRGQELYVKLRRCWS